MLDGAWGEYRVGWLVGWLVMGEGGRKGEGRKGRREEGGGRREGGVRGRALVWSDLIENSKKQIESSSPSHLI